MVGFKAGNDGKFVSEEYHRFREEARRNTLSITEWGEIEISKYDLNNIEFDGKDNRRTYIWKHSVSDDEISVEGYDVRNNPSHD